MNQKNKKPVSKKRKKKKQATGAVKTLKIIGTALLCLILIFIITGTIIVTALTVYVMKFMDNSKSIDLDNVSLGFTTHVYADGENESEYVEIGSFTNGDRRIWVNLEQIPQHVRDAFVCSEDVRFYDHSGVDFKRTFSAVVKTIFGSPQGGSTITQQVVKNITGENEYRIQRKLREMFAAINLEKNYTKDDILEAYLNLIYFNNHCYGIQAASNFYFDKDVSELSIAEVSCLAAMTKSPISNNPIGSETQQANNKERREYILKTMLDNGAISTEEYKTALNAELEFVGYNKINDGSTTTSGVTSYFYDAAINQAIEIMADVLEISEDKAEEVLRSGGYNIYTTENIAIQTEMEEKFKDQATFTWRDLPEEDRPQAAGIIMDYYGNILGVVGGIGEKTESRGLNYATDTKRPPGSTIKPIAAYGPAIYYDKITWSSIFKDEPIKIFQPSTGKYYIGPKNYNGVWTYEYNNVPYYLRRSINTIPAQIIHNYLTEDVSFDFLVNNLHFTTLNKEDDCYLAPLSVGSFSHGMYLQELVNAYQVFGNLGKYYPSTFIKRITDSEGKIVYEHKYIYDQAMDSESAWIMNRLLNEVVNVSGGTGVAAKTGINVNLIGKTGTSDNKQDILFVGCTPEYVSGIWYGFDSGNKSTANTYNSSPYVWNSIFKDIINNNSTVTEFTPDPNVVIKEYCVDTGMLAGPDCENTALGYYKSTNLPPMCNGHHNLDDEEDTEETSETTDNNETDDDDESEDDISDDTDNNEDTTNDEDTEETTTSTSDEEDNQTENNDIIDEIFGNDD